jgi:hypothetical protein
MFGEQHQEKDLSYLADPEKLYLIRICMPEAEGFLPANDESVLMECDGCNRRVWVHTGQQVPGPPEGVVIEGNINLCIFCYGRIYVVTKDASDE